MKQKLASLAILAALTVASCHAQIQSGTIVVFGQSQDRFVIASDSRVTPLSGAPDDHQCKIAAFKSGHAVFAATGAAGYTNQGKADPLASWSALTEAKNAVAQRRVGPEPSNAVEAVLGIADAWRVNTLARWKQTAKQHPDEFKQIVAREKGTLTDGVFAVAYKGQIAFAVSTISVQGDSLIADLHQAKCHDLCSMGQTNVISSHRSQTGLFEGADQMKLAIGLVDLTEKEDRTGAVHGPTDALELFANGTIRWKQKKTACQDSQD